MSAAHHQPAAAGERVQPANSTASAGDTATAAAVDATTAELDQPIAELDQPTAGSTAASAAAAGRDSPADQSDEDSSAEGDDAVDDAADDAADDTAAAAAAAAAELDEHSVDSAEMDTALEEGGEPAAEDEPMQPASVSASEADSESDSESDDDMENSAVHLEDDDYTVGIRALLLGAPPGPPCTNMSLSELSTALDSPNAAQISAGAFGFCSLFEVASSKFPPPQHMWKDACAFMTESAGVVKLHMLNPSPPGGLKIAQTWTLPKPTSHRLMFRRWLSSSQFVLQFIDIADSTKFFTMNIGAEPLGFGCAQYLCSMYYKPATEVDDQLCIADEELKELLDDSTQLNQVNLPELKPVGPAAVLDPDVNIASITQPTQMWRHSKHLAYGYYEAVAVTNKEEQPSKDSHQVVVLSRENVDSNSAAGQPLRTPRVFFTLGEKSPYGSSITISGKEYVASPPGIHMSLSFQHMKYSWVIGASSSISKCWFRLPHTPQTIAFVRAALPYVLLKHTVSSASSSPRLLSQRPVLVNTPPSFAGSQLLTPADNGGETVPAVADRRDSTRKTTLASSLAAKARPQKRPSKDEAAAQKKAEQDAKEAADLQAKKKAAEAAAAEQQQKADEEKAAADEHKEAKGDDAEQLEQSSQGEEDVDQGGGGSSSIPLSKRVELTGWLKRELAWEQRTLQKLRADYDKAKQDYNQLQGTAADSTKQKQQLDQLSALIKQQKLDIKQSEVDLKTTLDPSVEVDDKLYQLMRWQVTVLGDSVWTYSRRYEAKELSNLRSVAESIGIVRQLPIDSSTPAQSDDRDIKAAEAEFNAAMKRLAGKVRFWLGIKCDWQERMLQLFIKRRDDAKAGVTPEAYTESEFSALEATISQWTKAIEESRATIEKMEEPGYTLDAHTYRTTKFEADLNRHHLIFGGATAGDIGREMNAIEAEQCAKYARESAERVHESAKGKSVEEQRHQLIEYLTIHIEWLQKLMQLGTFKNVEADAAAMEKDGNATPARKHRLQQRRHLADFYTAILDQTSTTLARLQSGEISPTDQGVFFDYQWMFDFFGDAYFRSYNRSSVVSLDKEEFHVIKAFCVYSKQQQLDGEQGGGGDIQSGPDKVLQSKQETLLKINEEWKQADQRVLVTMVSWYEQHQAWQTKSIEHVTALSVAAEKVVNDAADPNSPAAVEAKRTYDKLVANVKQLEHDKQETVNTLKLLQARGVHVTAVAYREARWLWQHFRLIWKSTELRLYTAAERTELDAFLKQSRHRSNVRYLSPQEVEGRRINMLAWCKVYLDWAQKIAAQRAEAQKQLAQLKADSTTKSELLKSAELLVTVLKCDNAVVNVAEIQQMLDSLRSQPRWVPPLYSYEYTEWLMDMFEDVVFKLHGSDQAECLRKEEIAFAQAQARKIGCKYEIDTMSRPVDQRRRFMLDWLLLKREWVCNMLERLTDAVKDDETSLADKETPMSEKRKGELEQRVATHKNDIKRFKTLESSIDKDHHAFTTGERVPSERETQLSHWEHEQYGSLYKKDKSSSTDLTQAQYAALKRKTEQLAKEFSRNKSDIDDDSSSNENWNAAAPLMEQQRAEMISWMELKLGWITELETAADEEVKQCQQKLAEFEQQGKSDAELKQVEQTIVEAQEVAAPLDTSRMILAAELHKLQQAAIRVTPQQHKMWLWEHDTFGSIWRAKPAQPLSEADKAKLARGMFDIEEQIRCLDLDRVRLEPDQLAGFDHDDPLEVWDQALMSGLRYMMVISSRSLPTTRADRDPAEPVAARDDDILMRGSALMDYPGRMVNDAAFEYVKQSPARPILRYIVAANDIGTSNADVPSPLLFPAWTIPTKFATTEALMIGSNPALLDVEGDLPRIPFDGRMSNIADGEKTVEAYADHVMEWVRQQVKIDSPIRRALFTVLKAKSVKKVSAWITNWEKDKFKNSNRLTFAALVALKNNGWVQELHYRSLEPQQDLLLLSDMDAFQGLMQAHPELTYPPVECYDGDSKEETEAAVQLRQAGPAYGKPANIPVVSYIHFTRDLHTNPCTSDIVIRAPNYLVNTVNNPLCNLDPSALIPMVYMPRPRVFWTPYHAQRYVHGSDVTSSPSERCLYLRAGEVFEITDQGKTTYHFVLATWLKLAAGNYNSVKDELTKQLTKTSDAKTSTGDREEAEHTLKKLSEFEAAGKNASEPGEILQRALPVAYVTTMPLSAQAAMDRLKLAKAGSKSTAAPPFNPKMLLTREEIQQQLNIAPREDAAPFTWTMDQLVDQLGFAMCEVSYAGNEEESELQDVLQRVSDASTTGHFTRTAKFSQALLRIPRPGYKLNDALASAVATHIKQRANLQPWFDAAIAEHQTPSSQYQQFLREVAKCSSDAYPIGRLKSLQEAWPKHDKSYRPQLQLPVSITDAEQLTAADDEDGGAEGELKEGGTSTGDEQVEGAAGHRRKRGKDKKIPMPQWTAPSGRDADKPKKIRDVIGKFAQAAQEYLGIVAWESSQVFTYFKTMLSHLVTPIGAEEPHPLRKLFEACKAEANPETVEARWNNVSTLGSTMLNKLALEDPATLLYMYFVKDQDELKEQILTGTAPWRSMPKFKQLFAQLPKTKTEFFKGLKATPAAAKKVTTKNQTATTVTDQSSSKPAAAQTTAETQSTAAGKNKGKPSSSKQAGGGSHTDDELYDAESSAQSKSPQADKSPQVDKQTGSTTSNKRKHLTIDSSRGGSGGGGREAKRAKTSQPLKELEPILSPPPVRGSSASKRGPPKQRGPLPPVKHGAAAGKRGAGVDRDGEPQSEHEDEDEDDDDDESDGDDHQSTEDQTRQLQAELERSKRPGGQGRKGRSTAEGQAAARAAGDWRHMFDDPDAPSPPPDRQRRRGVKRRRSRSPDRSGGDGGGDGPPAWFTSFTSDFRSEIRSDLKKYQKTSEDRLAAMQKSTDNSLAVMQKSTTDSFAAVVRRLEKLEAGGSTPKSGPAAAPRTSTPASTPAGAPRTPRVTEPAADSHTSDEAARALQALNDGRAPAAAEPAARAPVPPSSRSAAAPLNLADASGRSALDQLTGQNGTSSASTLYYRQELDRNQRWAEVDRLHARHEASQMAARQIIEAQDQALNYASQLLNQTTYGLHPNVIRHGAGSTSGLSYATVPHYPNYFLSTGPSNMRPELMYQQPTAGHVSEPGASHHS